MLLNSNPNYNDTPIKVGDCIETTNLPFQIRGQIEKIEDNHVFVRTRTNVLAHINLKHHEIKRLEA